MYNKRQYSTKVFDYDSDSHLIRSNLRDYRCKDTKFNYMTKCF